VEAFGGIWLDLYIQKGGDDPINPRIGSKGKFENFGGKPPDPSGAPGELGWLGSPVRFRAVFQC
jgi:hypothetical protein